MLKIDKVLAKKVINSVKNNKDYAETLALKAQIALALSKRKEPYITAIELDSILKWKLDKQYHRSKTQREVNLDGVVVPITKACFAIQSSNVEYKTEIQLKLLTTLRGIATPLASAVLAICFPHQYAVIDSVLWEYIYGNEKNSFTTKDYLIFIEDIKKLACLAEMNIQDAEFGLWLLSAKSK
ncbi:hypothetical protein C2751_07710 [Polynucleobacter paneuropaeus]|uniref:hypothetical protein n=1 Tax=Polynucleobacter paneuropaeus TaxID=2527775 RepID=UPI001BFED7C2|nr:hypothetical protein [Polynucleobacter paneuropaeus]MBT8635503.1 hypothetical protein [Polynucleobacter paneuropaeus]